MTSVIVVGGGLAGLVATRHLARAGCEVELFERESTLGGRVRSRSREGFVLDRGFQVLLAAYPATRRELDYDALDLRGFSPGATLAEPDTRSIVADPLREPGTLTETLFNRSATLRDKLQILALRRDLAELEESAVFAGPDESISEYLQKRGFSKQFIERFFAPFYGGITLDRSLSTSAAVFQYTFRMLAEGSIAVPAAGMGAIPDQLAAAVSDRGATIHRDAAVSEVTASGTEEDGTDEGQTGRAATVTVGGETRDAEAVVVATDPKTARELTDVASIPTEARGCVTQYLAVPTHQFPDTGGRLVVKACGPDEWPNHVAPLSAVAPEYAPEGRELLSATYLGEPDATDATLTERSLDALERWYPERRFEGLEHLATDRIEFAQFAQPPGFYRDLPTIDAPDGPVYLAGDYTRWSSIHAAMDSGRAAARAVLDAT